MRKVYEDLLAEEIAGSIDICWDGEPIKFSHQVELENELFVETSGIVEYTYEYDESTDYIYMTWCSVTIEDLSVNQFRDGDEITPNVHFNSRFVEKYTEQYLMKR